MLCVKSDNKPSVLHGPRVGFRDIPGLPFPLRHPPLQKDKRPNPGRRGGGQVRPKTRFKTPASLPHSGPVSSLRKLGERVGRRERGDFQAPLRPQKCSRLVLCSWPRRNTRREGAGGGGGEFPVVQAKRPLEDLKPAPFLTHLLSGKPRRAELGSPQDLPLHHQRHSLGRRHSSKGKI